MFKKFSRVKKKCNRIILTQNHLPKETDINSVCRFDKKKSSRNYSKDSFDKKKFFYLIKDFLFYLYRDNLRQSVQCVFYYSLH